MSRTPLAWRNLLHERPRTLVAVAGVAFAVTLIFVQRGFFVAVRRTATLVYDHLDFDLALLAVPTFGRHVTAGETETDLGLERGRVEGRFTFGSGFAAGGLVVTGLRTFADIFGPPAGEQVSLGLIQLAGDTDPEAARRVADQ